MNERPKYGENFLSELIEQVPGMFFCCKMDKSFTLIKLDGGCLELTGFDRTELLEGSVIDFQNLVHLEDRKWLPLKRQEQIKSSLPVVNEYRIISRQGKIKWVREIASAHIGDDGITMDLEGFIQDITPYKLNAFMSNAFTSFQNAVNNGSIVSITDKKGAILFVNDNFVQISKFKRQELIGKDHRLVNSGYHTNEFFEHLWKTILKGDIWRGQIQNMAKDGTIFWVDTVITPVLNERNEIEQFLSIRNLITEQKENEYALLESEALNKSALKSLQANIAILDEEGVIIKVNENWIDFSKFGDGRNLFITNIGENYFDLIKKSAETGDTYAKRLFEGLMSVLNDEKEYFELEYPCIAAVSNKWFLLHISKFENDITRLVVSHFEITQRKQHESILEQSQLRMAEAQRIAKIGSWEHDFKTNELIWSDETFSLFGVDKHQFVCTYDNLLSIIHPNDRELVHKAYQDSVSQHSAYNVDHRVITPEGKIRYINERCETFYDEKGHPIRSIGTSQDISSQMEFELTLEKQRTRYKNVVENISDGLIIDDVDGHILFSNQQFMDMVGIKEEELKDFVFLDHVALEFKADIEDRHKRRMAGEDVSTVFEYAGYRKDESKRWFEVRVTKIVENGLIKGTQSAIRDITEEKEAFDLLKASEEEKTNLLNELTKRFNELMQFNYIVSHNLRAPIANLMGLSEVFEMPNVDDEEKEKIIEHIRFSILKIDDLIQDLNIILAARSDINSKREMVDFEEAIMSVKHTLEHQILESDTRITMRIANDAKSIFTIKSFLKSSIYNLINNAIKYRSPERRPEIDIEIDKLNHNYVIKVADNGIGIDLERYGKEVFGLYKRFNYSVEGKGLGLNMTKAQIEALGGNIELESELGVGTTFTIYLPEEKML
ncbi:MAG: PAS domain-containing protein [Bacteroidia bacterium]|nr:PAS domain-containing protein [Bacteroidia bacterium]